MFLYLLLISTLPISMFSYYSLNVLPPLLTFFLINFCCAMLNLQFLSVLLTSAFQFLSFTWEPPLPVSTSNIFLTNIFLTNFCFAMFNLQFRSLPLTATLPISTFYVTDSAFLPLLLTSTFPMSKFYITASSFCLHFSNFYIITYTF